jgi:DNA polymerase III delta prime subunit
MRRRPSTDRDAPLDGSILGHRNVQAALDAAVRTDRLPHALLFTGPEGVGKRTLATALARRLVAGDDAGETERFDRGAHERFLLYSDLEKPLPVRRGDLLGPDLDEAGLLAAYRTLEEEEWIRGISDASGEEAIDLLVRNPERYTGRKGIPFAEVLERELGVLERSRRSSPAAVAVARRLFSVGTSHAPYRRSLGIERINGKGDGALFRNVSAFLKTAGGGGWRVAILDDAQKMTDAAENAFLKTLEEPPPDTLLILVTSEPLSLLPTTLSRCARVVFDALPPEDLAGFLTRTQGVPENEAPLVAALAEGSLGRALELLGLDFSGRRELVVKILEAIGRGDLADALARTGACLANAAAEATERPRDRERHEARLLLELLALGLRDVILARAAPTVPPISGIDADLAAELTTRHPAETWEELFARTELARSDLAANVEPRLAIEALFADAFPAGEPVS